jgi:hypothetical protein
MEVDDLSTYFLRTPRATRKDSAADGGLSTVTRPASSRVQTAANSRISATEHLVGSTVFSLDSDGMTGLSVSDHPSVSNTDNRSEGEISFLAGLSYPSSRPSSSSAAAPSPISTSHRSSPVRAPVTRSSTRHRSIATAASSGLRSDRRL